MYTRNQILQIQTADKKVTVNKVNNKYERIFKSGRQVLTAWVAHYERINPLVEKFLATGEVNAAGVWVV